jgi:hypothetical protein
MMAMRKKIVKEKGVTPPSSRTSVAQVCLPISLHCLSELARPRCPVTGETHRFCALRFSPDAVLQLGLLWNLPGDRPAQLMTSTRAAGPARRYDVPTAIGLLCNLHKAQLSQVDLASLA